MSWLRRIRRGNRGDDLARELDSYLSHEVDRNMAAGMPPREAAWAARRKIGNLTAIKESSHDMNPLRWLDSVSQDLRYGARLLRMNPGFTAVAVISLALGIGANTAIFQLVDSVRLRLLPVPHAEQLAALQIAPNPNCCSGNFSDRHPDFTYAQWEQIRDRQQAFSGLFAWGDTEFNLADGGEVRMAEGIWVTGEFFQTLGVSPLLGRVVNTTDDYRGCGNPGAVISYAFWQSQFGGDPTAVGKQVSLEGHRLEVIGVTPAGFYGVEVGRRFDIAVPACAEPLIRGANAHTPNKSHWWLSIIGRLKPGWTVARASAEAKAFSRAVFENTVPPNYRADAAKYYVAYQLMAFPAGSGVSSLREEYNDPLLILLGIAGLVLLIACANLANLMLARASTREREMAIRLAIGANRGRLIRQLLAESFLLAAAGAGLGGLLAQFFSRYLLGYLSTGQDPLFLALSPNWQVLAFTAAVAVLTCVLFGLTPALRATRTVPAAAMKASGRGITADRERFGLRRVLVICQVALSLVLLVGALLFAGSLRNLLTVDSGFRESGVLITRLDLSRLNLAPGRRAAFYQDLLTRVRAIPGMQDAATASIVPVSGRASNRDIEMLGQRSRQPMIPWLDVVSDGYFHTMRTSLLAGRDFNEHDDESSPGVAIVNQEFVRKYLAGANPLGRQFRMLVGPGEPQQVYQIVGVARNSKYQSLRDDFVPVAFLCARQEKEPRSTVNIILRSNASLGPAIAAVKGAILHDNPAIDLRFQSFPVQLRESLLRERLMATLSGFFGMLAAVLAAVGLYGVISYRVIRRRNEIGIRMALGAGRRDVLNLIAKELGVLLLGGLLIGLALSIAGGRAAASLLYGLRPYEPSILAFAAVLMCVVAIAATLIPSVRACRLDPMTALREE